MHGMAWNAEGEAQFPWNTKAQKRKLRLWVKWSWKFMFSTLNCIADGWWCVNFNGEYKRKELHRRKLNMPGRRIKWKYFTYFTFHWEESHIGDVSHIYACIFFFWILHWLYLLSLASWTVKICFNLIKFRKRYTIYRYKFTAPLE